MNNAATNTVIIVGPFKKAKFNPEKSYYLAFCSFKKQNCHKRFVELKHLRYDKIHGDLCEKTNFYNKFCAAKTVVE